MENEGSVLKQGFGIKKMNEISTCIQVKDLFVEFKLRNGKSLSVIENISFQVKEKEFVCLVGPSGCGKSTILNLISNLVKPTYGNIGIGSTHDTHAPTLGYVFQDSRLLNWLTVRENITFALKSMQISRGIWDERVDHYLKIVGLRDFANEYPLSLSGGMQQRVSIARALSVQPEILLMDEPFSNLDELTARGLRRDLLEIWEKEKKAIIFVTHNATEAVFLADRILVLSKRPTRILQEKDIPLPRPRSLEDTRLFEIQKGIVSVLENHISSKEFA